MSTLAAQQQALLAALFEWPPHNAINIVAHYAMNTGARGLKAYQANGHAHAQGSLQSAYPVVAQLMGSDGFADLARALWHAHPPLVGDLALWGGDLATFLRDSAQLQEEPYLADVARAEWALHVCSTAADAWPDPASLALLTRDDPEQLSASLAPGCALIRSDWPIFSILAAHLHGQPTLAQVGEQLRAKTAQDLVVWRQGLRPEFRLAQAGEATLLEQLMSGASIGYALDQSPALDFAAWLPTAIQTGLVLHIRPMPTHID